MDDYCFQTLAYISKYIVYHKVGRLLISYSLKKRYQICEYRIPKILLDNKIEKRKPSTNKSPTKLMSFGKNMERTWILHVFFGRKTRLLEILSKLFVFKIKFITILEIGCTKVISVKFALLESQRVFPLSYRN